MKCITTISSAAVIPTLRTIPLFWTLPRYLAKVEEVRSGLGLDSFVLYGHSWGGMLAMEYAAAHLERLRGLVISNMTAGVQSYLERTAALKDELLSPELRARFDALEKAKDYENPEYTRILMEVLYPQMICRLQPWPEPALRAVRKINEKTYDQMQGQSEFEVTGNLKD